jgi:glutamyl-tRNA synthetase
LSDEIRVRFAPSPTGHLHVGGARTALFNWLFARNGGGKFILRIEDTDRERSTQEAYQAIVDALEWLGLAWDEGPVKGGEYGPYFQSERRCFYEDWSRKLVDEGKAYTCFCTPKQLADMREEMKRQGRDPKYDRRCRSLPADEVKARLETGEAHVLRFKAPLGGETVFDDLVRGTVSFKNAQLDDFVIVKSDGFPTYNFAATVDDAMMRISHIIRGEDHLSNTPKQILLYRAFELEPPAFAHVPLILGTDRTRLSKRHGATSVGQFRRDGYLPEALVNYLALLGWSYDGSTDLFSLEDLIEHFSLDRVSSTAAVFDYSRLQWLNGEYMKRRPVEDEIALVIPHLVEAGLVSEPVDEETRAYLVRVLEVLGDRLKLAAGIAEQAAFFFGEEVKFNEADVEKFLRRHYIGPAFKLLTARLEKVEPFEGPAIEPLMRQLVGEMGLKTGELFQPVRVALTGSRKSPDLMEVMEVLGRDRVIQRLERARRTFS